MSDRYLYRPLPRPLARMRLFCFAPAGYGGSIYRDWGKAMPDGVEVCAVRLPGRENVRAEPFAPDFGSLVVKATEILEPYLDRPYAAFGHSMGSWLAFESCHWLREHSGREPLALFVSGRRAPHIAGQQTPIHHLPQAEFIAEIQRRYNGIPAAVLSEPELLALTLPVLRADLAVLTSYRYRERAPFSCPLFCYSGDEDHEITPGDLDAWREHTTGGVGIKRFPGDHFYLTGQSGAALRAHIAAQLPSSSRQAQYGDSGSRLRATD